MSVLCNLVSGSCSLCASKYSTPTSVTQFHFARDEFWGVQACVFGEVCIARCMCGDSDCGVGQWCEKGICYPKCAHGQNNRDCKCGFNTCPLNQYCDLSSEQCLQRCSRSECNFHGVDPDPSNGCDECICDTRFEGAHCEIESRDISELRLAFCHPVLFGDISITRLEIFLDYYRLLGYDHFYFWFEKDTGVEKFLTSQPDVTSLIYDEDYEVKTHEFFYYPKGYGGQQKSWYHGQNVVIHSCLKLAQRDEFDWVQFGDADEFLYFPGPNIRSFLSQFQSMAYLTLGKFMYSHQNCDGYSPTGNELFQFVYRTESPYCTHEGWRVDERQTFETCNSFFGRRKYLIQPHLVHKLQIHEPVAFDGAGLDLSTSVAYLREIPGFAVNPIDDCLLRTTESTINIENESQFIVDFHGDFSTYKTHIENGQSSVTLVRDVEFQEWLYILWGLPFARPILQLSLGSNFLYDFKRFFAESLRDPCAAEVKLHQDWEVCGFGCAINLIAQQIIDAFFRQKKFTISPYHKDYQRYFKHVFSDVLPICYKQKRVEEMRKLLPINPHYFYQTHVHDDSTLRPLFQFLLRDIFWNNIHGDIQRQVPDDFPLNEFSTVHIRRGDKCHAESTCPSIDKYFDHIDPETLVFLMTDSASDIKRELDQHYPERMDRIVSISSVDSAWNDGSFIDVVKEVTIAIRAKSIVCAGSSNICRLLWALTSVEVVNVDTKSILCGDAQNIECLFMGENPVHDQLNLAEHSGRHLHFWSGSIQFHMKGITGEERIILHTENSDAKIRVKPFWTLVQIGPLSRSKIINISFLNGDAENGIEMKPVSKNVDAYFDISYLTRWGEWKCDDKPHEEDTRCAQVRIGRLKWSGQYSLATNLLHMDTIPDDNYEHNERRITWSIGDVRLSKLKSYS